MDLKARRCKPALVLPLASRKVKHNYNLLYMSRILRSIAALVPVTLGSYLVQVQRQISILKSSQVTRTEASPARFESKSFAVVSPRGHDRSHDTRSIVIELPKAKRFDSKEKILAEFVEGFFGGWVFTPERTVLRVLRKRLVNFSRKFGPMTLVVFDLILRQRWLV